MRGKKKSPAKERNLQGRSSTARMTIRLRRVESESESSAGNCSSGRLVTQNNERNSSAKGHLNNMKQIGVYNSKKNDIYEFGMVHVLK